MLGIFFLCLIVCMGFFVPLENFNSYGDVTITGEAQGPSLFWV